MILAIDIGNSNIVAGGLEGGKVCFVERLSTNRHKTELEYAIDFKNILELHGLTPRSLEGGILTSVVPQISNTVKRSAELLLGRKILQVSPSMNTAVSYTHLDVYKRQWICSSLLISNQWPNILRNS